jgi:hypothetical protein
MVGKTLMREEKRGEKETADQSLRVREVEHDTQTSWRTRQDGERGVVVVVGSDGELKMRDE